MNEIMKMVLSLSLSGSLLILILLLCKPLYRSRLSKRWQYYIWLVVLARLLLPVTWEGGPVEELFQWAETPAVQAEAETGFIQEEDAVLIAPSADAPVKPGNLPPEEPESSAASIADAGAALLEYAWLIWLGLAVVLLIRRITVYQSFVKYVRACREEVTDVGLLDRLARIGETAGVKQPVELYVNRFISSPLLLGVFRPCIVLPDAALPEEDFRYTVLHELTHYKRRDLIYKWLIQVTVCLYWFDPLVWLMEREAGRDCELSCDEAVIRRLDARGRKAYGDTLLHAVETGGGYHDSLASISLSEGAELLKERLKAIMNYKKSSKWAAVLSLVLTVLLTAGASAAGAYVGPAAQKQVPPDVKGDRQAGFRYTQEAYYQAPFFFDIGWNLNENAGRSYARTAVALDEGKAMTVYYDSACGEKLKDPEVFDALTAVIARLWRETRNTEFPLTCPLLTGVRKTDGGSPAALAEQYYEEGQLISFGGAFALMDEDAQGVLLEKICSDGSVAFWGMALSLLETDSPLVARLAERTYDNGEIALFSVLTGHMGEEALESWLARAEEDQQIAFRSMLYNLLGRDRDLEKMKVDLEKRQAEEYKDYGIVKNGAVYTYQGKRVHIFLDLRANSSFVTLNMDPEGTVDVKVTRDADGSIRSVGSPTEEELRELFGDMDDWDDGFDNWDDIKQLADLSVGSALDIDYPGIKSGEIVYLGEFELKEGDRIQYDVSVETGNGLQVGLVKAGEEKSGVVYCSVSNKRQTDETLRCTYDRIFGDPLESGSYRLFFKATDGDLGRVTGKAAFALQNHLEDDVRQQTVEELPEEVRQAMDGCSVRKWYVIRYGDRQYVWCNGFAWSFGYAPKPAEDGWQVDIVRFQKRDYGNVLLALPSGGKLTVTVDGEPIDYTVIEAGK